VLTAFEQCSNTKVPSTEHVRLHNNNLLRQLNPLNANVDWEVWVEEEEGLALSEDEGWADDNRGLRSHLLARGSSQAMCRERVRIVQR
jgi:hypothetical protein